MAFLAGVSSDYYVRLEQGCDRHPSDQVLLSIARALQLDQDATAYLLQLAKDTRTAAEPDMSPSSLGGCQGLECWCVQLDVPGGQIFLEVAH